MPKRLRTRQDRRPALRAARGVLSVSPLLSALCGPLALAGPDGPRVVHGSASFSRSGATTVIHTSHTAVINYNAFGIAAHETVRFVQPDASSRVLNRVTGALPTRIDGSLLANGRVYITNPAGVYFGDGAIVNAGAIYAAAGSITNADFIRGIDRFYDLKGEVVNRGVIQADAAYLLGRRVANFGRIVAESGVVVMASADEILVGESGSNVYARVSKPTPGATGGVENAGEIRARRARLGVGDVYGVVLFDSSRVKAQRVTVESAATTLVSGEIDASDLTPGATGGRVEILGDRVGVTAARVDASGDAGGGAILVGGELQGGGDTRRASHTVVAADASLNADALTAGDGGTVIVWADGSTRFHGSISARGGEVAGDGGFAEVSGKRSLTAKGSVDLGAPNGASGTLLYDPDAIVIIGGTADGSDSPDASATNLETDAGNPGEVLFADVGDSTEPFEVYQSEIEGTDANIILEAGSSITVSGTFDNAEVLLANDRNLTLRTRNKSGDGDSAGGIDLTGSTHGADLAFRTQGAGTITLHAGYDAANVGSEAGDLAASLTVGRLTTAGGAIELRAGSSGGGTVVLLGDVAINGAGGLTVFGPSSLGANVSTNGGSVSFSNSSAVTLLADVAIDTDAAGGASNAGNVLFSSPGTINGAFALTIDASADGGGSGGGVTLGTIGGTTPLASLDVAAAALILSGGISLDGGGNADFTGAPAITLTANIAIDTDAAGGATDAGDVLFAPAGAVNGSRTLSINATADGGGASGAVSLGAAGTSSPLTGLTVSAASLTLNADITLNGGGNADFSGANAVTLASSVVIASDATGGNFDAGDVLFATGGTINGAFTLTIDATADGVGADGAVALGSVGATTPLTALEVSAASLQLASDLRVSGGGDIDLSGAPVVTLVGPVTIDTDAAGGDSDAGSVLFANASTLDGAFTLAIDTTADGAGTDGDVNLGAIGTVTPLTGFTVAGGRATLNGDLRTDGGDIDLSGLNAIVVAASLAIDTEAGDDDAAGRALLAGPAVSADAGALALTIDTSTAAAGLDGGAIELGTFNSAAGFVVATLALADAGGAGGAAGGVSFSGAASLGAIDLSGLDGVIEIRGATSITTADSIIDLTTADSIEGQTAGVDTLTLNAGTGDVRLPSVGQSVPLGALTVVSTGELRFTGSIALDGGGNADFTGSPTVVLASDVIIDSDAAGGATDAGDVLFAPAGTLNGAFALTID
ncbi:MAG TPA: filamentous hemagglutinin N-terminal domain-containing protein, partial [Phycisphaerales bacterium]|nr:filamentous hemagglutinin N-terminal domain-containing protein [Phycisphaerales bacterium]